VDAPTVADVTARSAFLAGRDASSLESLVQVAAGLVASLTGRDIGVTAAGGGDNPMGCDWQDVPAWLVPVAEQAVALMTESLVSGTSATAGKTRGSRQLASFTAGPYSESYFSPEVAARSQALHPDPTTAGLLWSLATECAREWWWRMWGISTGGGAAGVAVPMASRFGMHHPRY
jgi:hypothetical protein